MERANGLRECSKERCCSMATLCKYPFTICGRDKTRSVGLLSDGNSSLASLRRMKLGEDGNGHDRSSNFSLLLLMMSKYAV